MVLDSKIAHVKNHFGIYKPEQWSEIHPAWILDLDGIGPATLDHIRIYLAARDICLKDDQTPEFWRQHFHTAKIGHVMGSEDIGLTAPFTVLIDSQEQQPFTFQGISCDASGDGMPLIVPTRWKSLGAGWADYSIDGFEGRVHIERKSKHDAHGTILGWGDRRQRFERELENLAGLECSAVVVECSLGELLASAPSWGKKTAGENRKILHRQVMAWQQDFRVPWLFCDSRRLAEISTFRILERFHRKERERNRKAAKVKDETRELMATL